MNKEKSYLRFKTFDKYIANYQNNYRLYDPAMYLYKAVLDFKGNKFSNEFIELVYTTLIAWNMNSRGAQLSRFEIFKNSIKKNRNAILAISKFRLGKLNEKSFEITLKYVDKLFDKLDLVAPGKPKLVTYSKTLHFFIPHLFMPVDRTYTLKHFPYRNDLHKKSCEVFKKIFNQFNEFAASNNLTQHINKNRNRTIPKIIDNIIIGYYLNKKKPKK